MFSLVTWSNLKKKEMFYKWLQKPLQGMIFAESYGFFIYHEWLSIHVMSSLYTVIKKLSNMYKRTNTENRVQSDYYSTLSQNGRIS